MTHCISTVQGHPRSLILVRIKSAYGLYDFRLVRHSNLGPILHGFGDIAGRFWCSWPHPYSSLIWRAFPLDQIADVGVSP